MIRISTLAICVALFWNYASAQTADAGRRPYQARCAGCHGDDGTGGGHGPNIVDVRRPRATSKDAVRGTSNSSMTTASGCTPSTMTGARRPGKRRS